MSAVERRVETRRMVACALCGISYDASARTYRDIRAGRVEARCVLHRKRKPRAATVQATHRRFWLDRFFLSEIVEMGTFIEEYLSIRPSHRTVPEHRVLLASAAPRIHSNGDVDGEAYGTDLDET